MPFTVLTQARPIIASIAPTSGKAGDAIVITGTGYTNVSSVKFNGATAVYTVDSATQITATVPQGASSGPLVVATAGGSASTSFSVTGGGGSAIAVLDEGVEIAPQATAFNFVGAGVEASEAGDVVTVTIPSSGSSPPQRKTTNYTAVAGDVIIADTRTGGWTLTLPSSPAIGNLPIEVFAGSNLNTNLLRIALNNARYQGADGQTLQPNNPYESFKLAYAGISTGWVCLPQSALRFLLPSSIPGLTLWLKADSITGLSSGQALSSWPDSSGLGYNAAQATASKQPVYYTSILNGLPVVRFDAVDDILELPPVALGMARNKPGLTMFCVHRLNPVDTTASNKYLIAIAGATTSAFRALLTRSNASVNNYSVVTQRVDADAAKGTSDATDRGNAWYTGTGIFDWTNASMTAILNGTDINTAALSSAGNSEDVNALAITIGNRSDSLRAFRGDIAEIVVYDRVLSSSERGSVTAYLRDKYKHY